MNTEQTGSIQSLDITELATVVGGARKDPNVSREGNRLIVKSSACLRAGGRITDSDKRYFMCDNFKNGKHGKYDGYIAGGG